MMRPTILRFAAASVSTHSPSTGTASLALACLLLLGASPGARAVPLPPNASVSLTGVTTASRPELNGVLVAARTTPWDDLNGDTGFLATRVVRETAGTLDFYYRVGNDPTSTNAVFSIGSGDFGAFAIDVDFLSDGEGVLGLDTAASFAAPGHDTIDFFAGDHPRVGPGEASKWLFIRTDARAFTIDDVSYATPIALLDDSFDFTFAYAPSFVPVTEAVPLPGTLPLVGVGLFGVFAGWESVTRPGGGGSPRGAC